MGENTDKHVINFEKICRLCLHEKRTLSEIFESTADNNNLSIDQKIMACATIDLCKGDGLPTRICVKCLSSVNAAFDFRLQCENADKTLHKLRNLSSKKTDTETQVGDEEMSKTENDTLDDQDDDEDDDYEEQEEEYMVKNKEETLEENIILDEIPEEAEMEEEDEGDFYYLIKDNEDEEDEDSLEKCVSDNENNTVKEDYQDNLENVKMYKVVIGQDDKSEYLSKFKDVKFGNDDGQKSECPFCHKVLTRLEDHIRLLHRNKIYVCTKSNCGAEFLTLKNLQSHQLTCLELEKEFKCQYCSKEFHRKSNYKAHVKRHEDKKEFQCQLCNRAFVDSTGLRRHFLKHHEPEQEIFVSVCCGKKFRSKEGLRKHVFNRVCGVEVVQLVSQDSGNKYVKNEMMDVGD